MRSTRVQPRGAVVEFLVAAQIVPARCTRVAVGGAGFHRRDMAAQRGGGGDAEQEVDARRAAEIQHLRRAVMTVGADQDLNARPVLADLAHQAAQEVARLGTGRSPGWAQHGGDGAALAVEHDDRLEAVFVVVGVEHRKLLPAMDGVERVVDVERDAPRHLAEAGAVERHHGARHADQRARWWQVLEARDSRLRTQRCRIGQAPISQLEQRIVPQAVGIVAVLVAGGDHQQAEAQHLSEAMLDALRRARIVDARGGALGDAEARLDLTQRQQAAIGREGPVRRSGR